LKWTGFEARLWTSLWQTKQNGVVLNFTVNLRFSSVEEPDDYDNRIQELIDSQKSDGAELRGDQVRPNIIAIMNESFCDLSVIGLETNEPCLPFIDSLTENTIKGQTYVSVFSGHTANSEYEFLTGNSISFLPIGTVAYQMFTHENDYSLARQFNSLGYYSVAMHPYAASGWNRTSVYQRYDFDEMYFIDDFTDVVKTAEILNMPLKLYLETHHKGDLPPVYSGLSVSEDNVLVQAMKYSEDGKNIILRTFECAGKETEAEIDLKILGAKCKFTWRPQEIKTIAIDKETKEAKEILIIEG
jgi:hypothetical protein